jgi:hypothetical protein
MGFIRSVKPADTPAESTGSTRELAMVTKVGHLPAFRRHLMPRVAKGRKEPPLVPFPNFRFFTGIATIRERNQRSFLMTAGINGAPGAAGKFFRA